MPERRQLACIARKGKTPPTAPPPATLCLFYALAGHCTRAACAPASSRLLQRFLCSCRALRIRESTTNNLLKWQTFECFFFTSETIWFVDFTASNVLYLGAVVAIDFEVVYFLATLAADVGEFLLTLDAEVATACEVGGDACGRGTGEGVEHPGVLVGRGKDDAGEQGERLLRRVLAAGLFPWGNGWQSPHVGHLLVVIQVLHQRVVEMMGAFGTLACPDDELGRISEVAAADVWRRIGLSPRHDIQNLEAKFCEAVGDGEDVVIGAAYPDGAVLLNETEFYINIDTGIGSFYFTIFVSSLNLGHSLSFRFGFYGFNHTVYFTYFYLVFHRNVYL